MSLLELNHVSKAFGPVGARTEVLKDIKKPRIESSRTPPDSPVLRRSACIVKPGRMS